MKKNEYNTPNNFYYNSAGRRVKRKSPPCECLPNNNAEASQPTTYQPQAPIAMPKAKDQKPDFNIDYR